MSESRTKNSIRNIIYRLGAQLFSIILKFVSRSIFIYVLGVEYLSVNGLFSEILQMLSLADLGFGTAMVYSMYKPLAEGDEKKLAQLVSLYKKIYTYIACSISLVGIGLLPFLKYIINLENSITHIEIYYVLYLANTVASYLVVYKTCILTADQKNYLISKYNTIFSLISLVVTTFILYLSRSFLAYLIAQVVITYVHNFYVSHIAEKMYPFINDRVELLSKKEKNTIFNNVKSVFIYKVSSTLIGSTDNTLISVLLGTIIVGYYSNYSMVISNISLLVNICFSSVTASLGNLIVENDKSKNYEVYRSLQLISNIVSCIAVTGCYLMLSDFIYLWLGEKYVLTNIVVVAIVVNLFFSIVLMPIWSFREATGMYQKTKYIMVATALINLVLSVILGKAIGLAGILIATSIARLTTYFWYEPKLLFSLFFEMNIKHYYLGIIKNIVITIAMIIVCNLLFNKLVVTNWLLFIIKMIGIGLTTLFFTIILYCKDQSFNKAKKLILSVLKT